MKTLRIILNGKSADDPRVRDAVRAVRADGVTIEVRPTWESGDVQRLTREALDAPAGQRPDIIVAGGGDGTINEVVASAVTHGIPDGVSFGILPLGTANDFARSAGIDAQDIRGALRRAVDGPERQVDIGALDGRPFVNLITGGFGSQITAETDPALKKQLGGFAYALTGLLRVGELQPNIGTFRAEGFEWSGAFVALAIGNGRQAGGGIVLCPDAVIDDGKLDLMILPLLAPEAQGDIVAGLLRGGPAAAAGLVVRTQSAWVSFEGREPLHINLDGEPIETQAFRVECLPSRLRLRLANSPLLGRP
jgi:lipid kinase YegS